jgi:hypothetical protein
MIDKENQCWCPNCTAIFSNYYKKWKLENKDKTLAHYQKEICESFTQIEITDFVNPGNRKVEILNPTGEQIKRREYIKSGIPLDRGGHTEWDMNQITKFYIPVIVIVLILVLLSIIFDWNIS